jgi:hypothetical protein
MTYSSSEEEDDTARPTGSTIIAYNYHLDDASSDLIPTDSIMNPSSSSAYVNESVSEKRNVRGKRNKR